LPDDSDRGLDYGQKDIGCQLVWVPMASTMTIQPLTPELQQFWDVCDFVDLSSTLR
jgi:hypothetical protein